VADGSRGRVALVTGAGSGIGRATALAYLADGYRVVLAGRRLTALHETVEIGPAGESFCVAADIGAESDVERLVAQTLDQFGRLDVAVNCAGAKPMGGILDLPMTDFDHMIAITLRGTWLCVRHQARAMLKSGGGAIVNVSSISAVAGGPADYASAKAGVEGLTRAAALELARHDIRVNALRAGMFDTPMLHDVWNTADDPETALAPGVSSTMLGRVGDPAEAAAAIVWMTSPAASYLTGTCIDLDGGVLGRWRPPRRGDV
jgi:NAD(P)-dependent dehydrogenase (short-subunit alcohol dehydrogenase family)